MDSYWNKIEFLLITLLVPSQMQSNIKYWQQGKIQLERYFWLISKQKDFLQLF